MNDKSIFCNNEDNARTQHFPSVNGTRYFNRSLRIYFEYVDE